MNSQIALTSVVTASVLQEFKFLKYSFELFHGTEYQWFVRCDQASLPALSEYTNVICSKFVDYIGERPDNESSEFRSIMNEKMNAMEKAWTSGNWTSVVYFDADIVMTTAALKSISAVEGDIVLTPNYYPEETKHLASEHGHYNGGFVCARTRHFHRWWLDAYKSQPWKWGDQTCLDDSYLKFTVGALSDCANIGFWRSPKFPEYNVIPIDCEFLHVHLFQPLRTQRQWIDKTFALHCLKFLQQGHIPEHSILFKEALNMDESRWYEASLRLC